jgi:UDP-2,3-diacylglucosamine hydrolase
MSKEFAAALNLPFHQLPAGKKIFFVSDFHLGVPVGTKTKAREETIVQWLKEIESEAAVLFLLGDVFDFWFEYKTVVPKGFFNLFAQLMHLHRRGVVIHYFTGNHDMWAKNYLPDEIGLSLHRGCVSFEMNGKKFFIGHGDGLGPGDYGYKFIKKVFANPVCQWLFRWIHPDIGIALANFWSGKSRGHTLEEKYLGDEKEWLVQFCKSVHKEQPVDFFIFGHRHLVIDKKFEEGFRYLNLGEWFVKGHYAAFDGAALQILPVNVQ